MKCKHRYPRIYVRYSGEYNQPLAKMAETAGPCLDCGAWLSLGYSDETPVAVEVRAAEIAATYPTLHSLRCAIERGEVDGAEYAGWIEHAFDSAKVPEQEGEWAGYLARCIVEHDAALRAAAANCEGGK